MKPSRSLRIGIIVPAFPTYSETFFVSLVKGLIERHHEVFIFCNSKNEDKLLLDVFNIEIRDKRFRIIELSKINVVFNALKSIVRYPFTSCVIIRRQKKWSESLNTLFFNSHACDIYHFGFSGVAVRYSYLFGNLTGKKMISCLGTAENILPLTRPDRIENLRSVLKKADKVHCISYAIQEKVLNIFSAPTFVNHPGIDIRFFSPSPQKKDNRKIRILSVGRLVFQKGFAIGFLAISQLAKRFKNFQWTIVGEGKEFEELSFYRQALGLQEHVILAGKKDRLELHELYDAADIFFLPSISEGLANVVLEAMSMELALVTSDCGGMKEVVQHGINGLLSRSFDFKEMEELLFLLCENEALRLALGKEARKSVSANFNVERYVEGFEKNYFEMLQTS